MLQFQRSLPISVALQDAELSDLVRARRRSGHGGRKHRAAVGFQARRRQLCLVSRITSGTVHADSDVLSGGELAGERGRPRGDRAWRGRPVEQHEVSPMEGGVDGGADDLVADALLDHTALQPEQHQIRPVTQ